MLVLTRKAGQTLKIGKDVVVEVLGVPGSRVKLGIHAPQEVKILRGEIEDQEPPYADQPAPVPVAA